jgi:hypothetical protein
MYEIYRLRRWMERSGTFRLWLRCCSAVALRAMADKLVVDVYPLHRNALP